MGSMHSKLLVIDRKEAIVRSANVQDAEFLEFGVHVMGDVVDSLMAHFNYFWTLTTSRTPTLVLDTPELTEKQKENKAQLLDMPTFQYLSPHTFYTLHGSNKPIPMLLAPRSFSGSPFHESSQNPQNIAWNTFFDKANSSIFIQTPNMNSREFKKGVINAVRRGVKVTVWTNSRFNDAVESMPLQVRILLILMTMNTKTRHQIGRHKL